MTDQTTTQETTQQASPHKKVSIPEFINLCDSSTYFDEVAETLGVKPATVTQRYYKIRKKYPGIFRSKLRSKSTQKPDVLEELAKLRNMSVDELRQEMEKNTAISSK